MTAQLFRFKPRAAHGGRKSPLAPVMYRSLYWVLQIGRKMIAIAPLQTAVAIFLTVIADFCHFLAAFLPLKIVMLMGTEGMPRFLPDSWLALGLETLVIVLAGTAAFLLLLSSLIASAVEALTRRGATEIIHSNAKVALLWDQETMTRQAYVQFADGVAGLIFAAAGMLVMGLLYPAAALLVFAIFATGLLVAIAGSALSERFDAFLRGGPGPYLQLIRSLGLLLVLGYMIWEFFSGTMPNPLIALVAIILSRIVLGRGATGVRELYRLCRDQERLSAIFFHRRQAPAFEKSDREDFIALFDRSSGRDWLEETIGGLLGEDVAVTRRRLVEGSATKVMVYEVELRDAAGARSNHVVSVFDRGRIEMGKHEARLLSDLPAETPLMPPSFVSDAVGPYWVTVVPFVPTGEEDDPQQRDEIETLVELWTIEPPDALLKDYRRSRQTIEMRVTPEMLERLLIFAETERDRATVGLVIERLPEIRKRISRLPRVFVNSVGADSLYRTEDGRFFVAHWPNWSIEPIGANWPGAVRAHIRTAQSVKEAAKTRPALRKVDTRDVIMASYLSSFEQAYARERFATAIDILGGLKRLTKMPKK